MVNPSNPLSLSMSFHPGKVNQLARLIEDNDKTAFIRLVLERARQKELAEASSDGKRFVYAGLSQGEALLIKEIEVQTRASVQLIADVKLAGAHKLQPMEAGKHPDEVEKAFNAVWNPAKDKYQKVNQVATSLDERVTNVLVLLRSSLMDQTPSTVQETPMAQKVTAHQNEAARVVHDYMIDCWYTVPINQGQSYWTLFHMVIMERDVAKSALLACNIEAGKEKIVRARKELGKKFLGASGEDEKKKIQQENLSTFQGNEEDWKGYQQNYQNALQNLELYKKELQEAALHAANSVDLEGFSIQDPKIKTMIGKQMGALTETIKESEKEALKKIDQVRERLTAAMKDYCWQMNRYLAVQTSMTTHTETFGAYIPGLRIPQPYTPQGKQ